MEGIPQHRRIINEALKRKFEVQEKDPINAVLFIEEDTYHLKQGIILEWLNENAEEICDNKALTKILFQKLGIQSPASFKLENVEELINVHWDKNYVIKPEVGTNGDGVKMGIYSLGQVEEYLANNTGIGPKFLLEEFVEGRDLRIQIIGGKIVAACERIPAHVVGDGKSTLMELAEKRNKSIQERNPHNSLKIDTESIRLIKEQGFDLESVIPNGKSVQLKEIANMGQGAVAIDCTDEIDPQITEWVELICSELDAPYFALDIICTDRSDISTYKALELNIRAEWFHHTFSECRQHSLEEQIIDELEKDLR